MKYGYKIYFFFLGLLLLSSNAFAESIIASLKNPLDIQQIQKCEKYYGNICAFPETRYLADEIAKQWPCMNQKMRYDKSCYQAYLIRENTGYPPQEMRIYSKNISVFTIVTLADDQTEFFIVDKPGDLIKLTQDEKLVATTQYYIRLKKRYPELTLTTFIAWSKPFQTPFPKEYLSNDSIKLVFQQELRDGPCVACKSVGIATVAYVFDKQGKFITVKILKIKPLVQSV